MIVDIVRDVLQDGEKQHVVVVYMHPVVGILPVLLEASSDD
jgi:hypothetical protein